MYMEADNQSDCDSDAEDHVTQKKSRVPEVEALSCIKHVTFIVKSPPYDVYKLSQVSSKSCIFSCKRFC